MAPERSYFAELILSWFEAVPAGPGEGWGETVHHGSHRLLAIGFRTVMLSTVMPRFGSKGLLFGTSRVLGHTH